MDWTHPGRRRLRITTMTPVSESAARLTTVNPFARLRAVSSDEPADPIGAALRAAGQGDEAAFAEFYDLTSALVYGIVVKVVRDPAISEEVTQEVFVEIWRLAPRFDERLGSPKSWAATIAHRRAVDRVRSEQSSRGRDQREYDQRAAPADVVSEEVIDLLDRSRVERALADLSDIQREAVTLAYYGGHTYREVAILLDVPEGTVKTRIRDGLGRLRDQLGVEP